MSTPLRLLFSLALALVAAHNPVSAIELTGSRTITLHARDGQVVPIGTVVFQPAAGGSGFALQLDHNRLKDYFLSMKEFKCVDSPAEVLCHVPYPYANPRTVGAADFGWLEHDLLFFFKTPRDFGAKLWNGVYFRLENTPQGIIGTPQAVDLNVIGVPPDDLAKPPYGPAERGEIDPNTRWFTRLTIN